MTAIDVTSRSAIRRWSWPILAIGLIATGASASVARDSWHRQLPLYLVTWLFLWGMSLGSLVLVMIHHLTGGAWGLVLRRILEAQMRTLPLVALFFIPIALEARHIYPWAAGAEQTAAFEPRFQAAYLQSPFVWWRAVGYFLVWIVLAWLLGFWSQQEDQQASPRAAWKCQALSGPGLVVYAVTLHFAAIDWMMSIEPSFTSTIFGPIVAAEQLLSALALALVVLSWVARRPGFAQILSGKVQSDLGNLLFTLVIVWAYLVWCQAMLIWIADLRHDNVWWLARSGKGWQWIGAAIVLLGLVVPFFLLLFRAVKKNTKRLAFVSAIVLAAQFVFVGYQVLPEQPGWMSGLIWLSPLVALGLLFVWLAAFLWLLSSAPLVPLGDRNWSHARHLLDLDEKEAAREEAVAHG